MLENEKDTVLTWNEVPVLTTMMLAERLGVFEANIRMNFSNNKERFKLNEDHFILKGADVKILRKELRKLKLLRYQIDPRATVVILYTESGAHNHAKSASTNEAWEAFLHLKKGYYRQREALKAIKEAFISDHPLFEHTKRETQIENTKKAADKVYKEGGVPMLKEYHTRTAIELSGKAPGYWTKLAKDTGLKSKFYNSGREAINYFKPAVAASMSVHDAMYCHGGKVEEITPLCKTLQPVFEKMIELGMLKRAS